MNEEIQRRKYRKGDMVIDNNAGIWDVQEDEQKDGWVACGEGSKYMLKIHYCALELINAIRE